MSLLLDTSFIENTSFDNIINQQFFIRFLINALSSAIIIGGIHYRLYKQKEYVFTYFMMNTIIFFISYSLQKVGLSMGATFGLFAVFSMMKYRTEDITQKDMTYLFIVIALGVITAVQAGSWPELLVYNGLVVAITFLLEGNLIMRREISQSVQFENIELIKPEKRGELIEELKKRTGLNIHRVTISKIDFLKDSAMIKLYYYDIPR